MTGEMFEERSSNSFNCSDRGFHINNILVRGLKDTEAAEMLGLHPQTLRNRRSKGEGPPYYKIGRSVRYWSEDLISYIRERKIEPRH
jgi:predicted DNA-binding transcriptional regulator AlpA